MQNVMLVLPACVSLEEERLCTHRRTLMPPCSSSSCLSSGYVKLVFNRPSHARTAAHLREPECERRPCCGILFGDYSANSDDLYCFPLCTSHCLSCLETVMCSPPRRAMGEPGGAELSAFWVKCRHQKHIHKHLHSSTRCGFSGCLLSHPLPRLALCKLQALTWISRHNRNKLHTVAHPPDSWCWSP